MPTLTINGHRISVDDSFLGMSIDDQNATVDEIAKTLPSGGQKGLDATRLGYIERAKELVEARKNGTPLAKPQGHNVPETLGSYEGPLDKIGAFAGGGLDGVPIVGPGLKAVAKAGAAAVNVPFSDKSFGEIYDEIGRMDDAAQSANPKTTLAGNVTGAVGGTLPAMSLAPGLFGLGQATKVGQALGSGLGGTLIGGADSAVRSGGDLRETVKGAGMGAVTGLVGPSVGRLAGKAVSGGADYLLNGRIARGLGVDRRALALMADAATGDGVDGAIVRQRLADLGPDAMLMDMGDNFVGQAAGLASMPGEAKSIIRGAIRERDAGANRRIMTALDDTLGPAPIPSRVRAGIDRNQQALSPEYRESFANAAPVDTRNIAQSLDADIQSLRGEAQNGVRRVRQMLNRVGRDELETDPGVLHETRKAIDGMLETATDTNARNALTTTRQAIDDELARSVPRIKEVDAKYAELARQGEGLQRGQTVLNSGREAPRPVELAEEFQQGALPQGEMVGPSAVPLRMQQGARAEIERIVGTNANDRVALQRLVKGEGDWNRDRLATLFGQDRANRIINVLDRERAFADNSQIITRNSETAARNASQAELRGLSEGSFGPRQAFEAGGIAGAGRSLALKAADKAVEALGKIKDERVFGQIANTLVKKDPAVIDALLKSAGGAGFNQSKIDRVARALLMSSVSGR